MIELQMDEPILDMQCLRTISPPGVRNAYFEETALEADQFLSFLQSDGNPEKEFAFWCLDSDQFFAQLITLRSDLDIWRMITLSTDWFATGRLLSLTIRLDTGWKTLFIPWPVVREIREPLQDLFKDAGILKVISTGMTRRLLETEISELNTFCTLRQFMMINTYDYQQCGVAVESPRPDDVVFRQVMKTYLGAARSLGISDVLKNATIPQTSQDINTQLTGVLFHINGLSFAIVAHAVLTTHAYLIGPSLASEDVERPLLVTADYINNMGILWGTWKPFSEISDGNSELIGLLSENLTQYSSQGILLHRNGIKPVIIDGEDKLISTFCPNNMDFQSLDRRTVRGLMKRPNERATPSSATPGLESIEEWDGIDPFGEWEGEENTRSNLSSASEIDFSILDEPMVVSAGANTQLEADLTAKSTPTPDLTEGKETELPEPEELPAKKLAS